MGKGRRVARRVRGIGASDLGKSAHSPDDESAWFAVGTVFAERCSRPRHTLVIRAIALQACAFLDLHPFDILGGRTIREHLIHHTLLADCSALTVRHLQSGSSLESKSKIQTCLR